MAGTASQKDTGLELINEHEEFRRAKRNALLWSGLAFLVGWSLPGSPLCRALFNMGQVDLPAWLVLLASLLPAVFMWLGFERAAVVLRLKNSKRLFESSAADAGEALESITHKAAALLGNFEQADNRAQLILKTADAHEARLAETQPTGSATFELETMAREYNSTVLTNAQRRRAGEAVDADPDLQQFTLQIARKAADHVARLGAPAGMARTDMVGGQTALTQEIAAIRREVGDLNASATELRTFHGEISQSSRRWHFWHDLVPVRALTGLAIALIALRAVGYLGGPSPAIFTAGDAGCRLTSVAPAAPTSATPRAVAS